MSSERFAYKIYILQFFQNFWSIVSNMWETSQGGIFISPLLTIFLLII